MAQYQKTRARILNGQIGNAIGSDGRMSFIPVISYRYEVNGQEYINDRFSQNSVGRRIQGAVQKIVDKYPRDSSVEIFYNVNDPQDSFIQKGFGTGVNRFLMVMLVGSLLVLAATLFFAESQGLINLF